jgi:hypothetical protein
MHKPYLHKHSEIAPFTVWVVDGAYIRRNLNNEFTNFGQHFRFPFIPRHELWLDKEYAPGEDHYFIDHLLLEAHLMEEGKPYEEALVAADKEEQRERARSAFVRMLNNPFVRPIERVVLFDIRKEKLSSYSKGPDVWIVNGEMVRNLFFIDFTEGGHDKVYPFVPNEEVWIDDDLSPFERKFVILHELKERALMKRGWEYHRAHHAASAVEYTCRHRPALFPEKLQEVLLLN